jgi:hypothetical protein
MSIITTHSLAAVPSAHRNVFFLLAKIRRAVNGWVADYLARQERRASLMARALDARGLKDVGFYRSRMPARG